MFWNESEIWLSNTLYYLVNVIKRVPKGYINSQCECVVRCSSLSWQEDSSAVATTWIQHFCIEKRVFRWQRDYESKFTNAFHFIYWFTRSFRMESNISFCCKRNLHPLVLFVENYLPNQSLLLVTVVSKNLNSELNQPHLVLTPDTLT